jgi:hypothetical protein
MTVLLFPLGYFDRKAQAQFNWSDAGQPYRLALLGASFAGQWNPSSIEVYADVSAFEVPNGSGYTTGGALVNGRTLTRSTPNLWVAWGHDPVDWSNLTADVRAAVLYKQASGNPIVTIVDFESTISIVARDAQFRPSTSGLFVERTRP